MIMKVPRPLGEARAQVKIWIDFVCPFCLLAEKPLRAAVEGLDVEIEWMPFELRPYPGPTLRPEDEYLPDIWRRAVYPMAARLGMRIRLPSVSPQPYSRSALEGLWFAQEHGRADEYVHAVFGPFSRKIATSVAWMFCTASRQARGYRPMILLPR